MACSAWAEPTALLRYDLKELDMNEDEDMYEDEKVDEAKRDLQHASQVWCELHGRPGTKEVGNYSGGIQTAWQVKEMKQYLCNDPVVGVC